MNLFKPAWRCDNKKKALRAVEKKTGKFKLQKIARSAPLVEVRMVAVKKLIDQCLLENIYTKSETFFSIIAEGKLTDQIIFSDIVKIYSTPILHLDVVNAAMENLSDQFLADLAKNNSEKSVRLSAIQFLNDQSAFAYIAKNDSDPEVRKGVVVRLTDQATLAYIAKNDSVSYVRLSAVERLTDQSALAYVVKNDNEPNVRREAVENLTDQSVLAYVALNESDYNTLYAVIKEKLIDKTVLLEVANNKQQLPEFRLIAAKKLTNTAQDIFADIAKSGCDNNITSELARREAFGQLTDQHIITDVANNAKSLEIRIEAMYSLKDKSGLVFTVNKDNCKDHDTFHFTILHKLPTIVVGGRCAPQCPYCGQALTRCSYGHKWLDDIETKDQGHKWQSDISGKKKCSVCGVTIYKK